MGESSQAELIQNRIVTPATLRIPCPQAWRASSFTSSTRGAILPSPGDRSTARSAKSRFALICRRSVVFRISTR